MEEARPKRKRTIIDYAAVEEGNLDAQVGSVSKWIPTIASYPFLDDSVVQRLASGDDFTPARAAAQLSKSSTGAAGDAKNTRVSGGRARRSCGCRL